MRKEFIARYPVRNVIVAYPSITLWDFRQGDTVKPGRVKTFFFPSYPRFFKNIEVIGEAARILISQGKSNFEVLLTIDGTENSYSRKLSRIFADVSALKFIGLQTRERIYDLYKEADCLIFPSRLETWGLPISEFKQFRKSILAADLPYAHETVGQYDLVRFFDPSNPKELALRMEEFLDGRISYDYCETKVPERPFAKDWDELLDMLVADGEDA